MEVYTVHNTSADIAGQSRLRIELSQAGLGQPAAEVFAALITHTGSPFYVQILGLSGGVLQSLTQPIPTPAGVILVPPKGYSGLLSLRHAADTIGFRISSVTPTILTFDSVQKSAGVVSTSDLYWLKAIWF